MEFSIKSDDGNRALNTRYQSYCLLANNLIEAYLGLSVILYEVINRNMLYQREGHLGLKSVFSRIYNLN